MTIVKNILIIAMLLFLISCNNNRNKEQNPRDGLNVMYKEEKKVVSLLLGKKINKLLALRDSLVHDDKIFTISIRNRNNKCFLTLATQPFYFQRYLTGYYVVDSTLIAFYEIDDKCNFNLVYKDQLDTSTSKLNDYPDESKRYNIGSYSPWGSKYRIYSDDSLELLKDGYL